MVTLPIVSGQEFTGKAWIALLATVQDLDLDLEPTLAITDRPDGLPVLLLGKPPTADTIEVGIDIMTLLEREERILVPGPSVAEVMSSPAGLERLRRAVRLWNMVRTGQTADPVYRYHLVEDDHVGLRNLVQITPGHDRIVVDIEVSGDIKKDEPEDTELISVAVLWPPNKSHTESIIHVWTREALKDEKCLQALTDILLAAPLELHNAQFDVKWLNNHLKPYLRGSKLYPQHDTLLCHYVMFPGATGDHGLKPLAQKLLGAPEWEKEGKKYTKGGSHYELIPPNLLYAYNAADVYWTDKLHDLLYEWLDEAPKHVQKLYKFVLRASRMFVDIEDTDNGWPVDTDMLLALRAELEPRVHKSLMKLRMTVGDPGPYLSAANSEQRRRYIEMGKPLRPQHDFNPGSWQQVQKWLRAQGVPCEGTSEKALTELIAKHNVTGKPAKFVARLLEYRHTSKMLTTYVNGVIESVREGRTRPRFKLLTTTGRASSWIHTIPRPSSGELEFRGPYTVDPGELLVHADYAQLELRIVAELCGDPRMIADLQEDQDDFFALLLPGAFPRLFPRGMADVWDLKESNPKQYKDLRNTQKPVVHGMNYGRMAGAIAKQFNMPLTEAQQFCNAYKRRFPLLGRWQRNVMEYVHGRKMNPYWDVPGLWTKYGRRFQQGVITDENEWTIKNQALAFEPQSTGSDICLSAAMDLHENRLHMFGARLVNSHHDALDIIAPERAAPEVAVAMEKVMRRAAAKVFTRVPFPVEVKIGKRWSEVSA